MVIDSGFQGLVFDLGKGSEMNGDGVFWWSLRVLEMAMMGPGCGGVDVCGETPFLVLKSLIWVGCCCCYYGVLYKIASTLAVFSGRKRG